MSDKKITYISLLQIVGPLFVVLGHSLNGLDIRGFWYIFTKEWIYIFHMPLFFLISGILFAHKKSIHEPFGVYIKKRFCGMMIPYFWFSLIYIGVDYYYLYAHPELITQEFIHAAMLQAVSLFGISVLWFLPTIFMCELCFYGLLKKSQCTVLVMVHQ